MRVGMAYRSGSSYEPLLSTTAFRPETGGSLNDIELTDP